MYIFEIDEIAINFPTEIYSFFQLTNSRFAQPLRGPVRFCVRCQTVLFHHDSAKPTCQKWNEREDVNFVKIHSRAARQWSLNHTQKSSSLATSPKSYTTHHSLTYFNRILLLTFTSICIWIAVNMVESLITCELAPTADE